MSRESDFDVGRNIENNSGRKSIRDVIRANCKRFEVNRLYACCNTF